MSVCFHHRCAGDKQDQAAVWHWNGAVESGSVEVQRAGGEIHLLLTTEAQVKCQHGAAALWLVLSPRSRQVSCSRCVCVGFLPQTTDRQNNWNGDTQIACGCERVCVSVFVTSVMDRWHLSGPAWVFAYFSWWNRWFRKWIDGSWVCGSRGSRQISDKLPVTPMTEPLMVKVHDG